MKRILPIFLALCFLFSCVSVVHAAPDLRIGSRSTMTPIFEFKDDVGTWQDLTAVWHYLQEDQNELVYCIDHNKESPLGHRYTEFDPNAYYSAYIQKGVLSILEHGYPMSNNGFNNEQAQYITANALRVFLQEEAGIGFPSMNRANGRLRAKSGYTAQYAWMEKLVADAKAGKVVEHSISASNVTLRLQGDRLVGTSTISGVNLNGGYTLNSTALPAGISVSGYTGRMGDVLTFSVPLSMGGQSINLTNYLSGRDNRNPAGVFWYEPPSSYPNLQRIIYPVFQEYTSVATGGVTLNSITGNLEINKRAHHNSAALDGAIFQVSLNGLVINVTRTGNGTYTFGGTSNQVTTTYNGKATITGIPEGALSIREITPPTDYNLDGTQTRTTSITAQGQTASVTFTNTLNYGHVEILKIGESTSVTLQNAKYGIYLTSNNTRVGELVTGSNGKATSGRLAHGAYYLLEEQPPIGYQLDTTKHPFTINGSVVTVTLQLSDEKIRGRAEILKEGEESDPQRGVVYGVYKADDTKMGTITTGANGKATTELLEYGSYYLLEEKAFVGHNLNPNKIPFNIYTHGTIITLKATNTKIRGQAQIKKTGEVDDPLQGVVYGVYRAI
ncbi:Cys-Gln thioester bond-forming surface protein, partial [Eubacteriales bacterium OttesenSCG-928-M02]|nr:Cys-Gln thioester bond-forming surface protein [Eubacteriales bacterium OttesenSCG-928-M02]